MIETFFFLKITPANTSCSWLSCSLSTVHQCPLIHSKHVSGCCLHPPKPTWTSIWNLQVRLYPKQTLLRAVSKYRIIVTRLVSPWPALFYITGLIAAGYSFMRGMCRYSVLINKPPCRNTLCSCKNSRCKRKKASITLKITQIRAHFLNICSYLIRKNLFAVYLQIW